MGRLVLIGASCEAEGHPTECTEPATGEVEETSSHSLSINGDQVATVDSAEMVFPSHAHDYSSEDGCHDNQSHAIDPDTDAVSSSLTVNGSPVYVLDDGVASDPVTDGDINIVETNGNNTVQEV